MLGGNGVPNRLPEAVRDIAVNRKADALFFLHAARIDAAAEPARDQGKEAVRDAAATSSTYADGKSVDVPIYAEIDIDDYRQKTPRAIPAPRSPGRGPTREPT